MSETQAECIEMTGCVKSTKTPLRESVHDDSPPTNSNSSAFKMLEERGWRNHRRRFWTGLLLSWALCLPLGLFVWDSTFQELSFAVVVARCSASSYYFVQMFAFVNILVILRFCMQASLQGNHECIVLALWWWQRRVRNTSWFAWDRWLLKDAEVQVQLILGLSTAVRLLPWPESCKMDIGDLTRQDIIVMAPSHADCDDYERIQEVAYEVRSLGDGRMVRACVERETRTGLRRK